MVANNFSSLLKKVLVHEGGYVNHPRDPGGETNKGVTKAVYDAFRRKEGLSVRSVRLITEAELQAIYRLQYWNVVKADDLPSGMDYPAFDGAINSGPSRGAKWLQGGLGVKADGVVGLATLQAARDARDKVAAVRKMCELRRSFLRGLKTFSTFGKGWMSRVAGVEAHAVVLAMTAQGVPAAEVPKRLESFADEASGKSQVNAGKAGAAGAGAASTPALPVTELVPWDTSAFIVMGIIGVALLAVALVFWRNSRAEAEVAEAYAAKASELAGTDS